MSTKNNILEIDGQKIKKGERKRVYIDMGTIYDFTEVKMPVEIIRGKKDGPTIFLSAAIHGDEICGIEIIRNVLKSKYLKNIAGTLIAVPIVNIFGFNDKTRYLPDRRDLNRCFPGNKNGSLAGQLAYKFTDEIVNKCDLGIDFHTGAYHRFNAPQIRANLKNNKALEYAKVFNAPSIIDANLRDGSLREAGSMKKIPILLYEGGEMLRFDKEVIDTGIRGVLNIMSHLKMIDYKDDKKRKKSFISHSSSWLRAPKSGILIERKKVGTIVRINDILGEIVNPFGDHKTLVKAKESGVIIGASKLPLVNQGDALFHIATSNDKYQNDSDVYYSSDDLDPLNS